VEFLAGERFVLYRERWAQRLHSMGCLAPGMLAFGVPQSPRGIGTWWGRTLPPGRLPFCSSNGMLEQVTEPGEAITVLAISERDFWPFFVAMTGLDPGDFPRRGRFLIADPAAVVRLRTTWNRMLARSSADGIASFTLADVIAPLLDAMHLPVRAEHPNAPTEEMLDLVLNAAAKSQFRASVPEISVELNVSRRTIECAFQRHLGESPHAYFRKRRLVGCRQALIEAEQESATVTAVALQHGFTDFGRFAATYRGQFGELPSATLRRKRVALPSIVRAR
jgi:AraC-like DNA-binding protein